MTRPRFEDRFPQLWDTAYRAAYRLAGSREVAEDAAQSALEKAFRRWRSVHDHAEPWVARVAANEVLDRLRHQQVVERTRTRVVTAEQSDDPHVEDRLALRAALDLLSDRQRAVVVLRHVLGYSVGDTATALQISEGSVKTHCHRALGTMREALGDRSRTLLGEEVP